MARKDVGRKFWQYTPDVYARTTGVWQTRVGRRNREFSSWPNLLGLNTAFDDLHKKDGESPFLRNYRYMGEKQRSQRSQATSRTGARFLASVGDTTSYPAKADAQTQIELHEGKAIEFEVPFTDVLVGGMLYVRNTEKAKGVLRIFLKPSPDEPDLCQAIIDLTKVSNRDFVQKEFRFIQAISKKIAKTGKVTIRLEILDDVEPSTCMSTTPVEGRKIEILATGNGSHRVATYETPNTDNCLREVPYEFTSTPSIPMFGIKKNAFTPMSKGIQICKDGDKYIVFPVRQGDNVYIYRYNINKDIMTQLNAAVAPIATRVTLKQIGAYIYYVDGESELRRIRSSDWLWEVALALPGAIDAPGVPPASLQAKKGASLMIYVKNRVYLSGFKDDPNLVQFSLINSYGEQPDQFNESFYSPGQNPAGSTCGPITVLEQFENSVIVFRKDGNSTFSAPTGLEFGKAQLVDTFAWNVGAESPDDVAAGNGSIYFYNRSEGMRRFSGTDTYFQSLSIDNELRRITKDSPRFMIAHGNKIRFYFDREGRGYADHGLIYHTMLANQSPWYMDDNVPVKWAIGDQADDTIYACHSTYPALFILDEEEQLTDFDCIITAQYHTAYKSPGGQMNKTIVRRVQAKLLANYTNSWFIGVDYDHRDKPAVWRKVIVGQVDDPANDDAVFRQTADAGSRQVNIFTRTKCNEFQIRFLTYCYRSQAELLYVQAEVGSREPL